jgi:hypothetical protein
MLTELKEEAVENLLEVADQIEQDQDYFGLVFWDREAKSGCAMTRIIQSFEQK